MLDHTLATRQLAKLIGIFAHPNRIRIVQELSSGEKNVKTLQKSVGIAHSGVSQHLSVLRAHKIVVERRTGRQVHYRLVSLEISRWLTKGFHFLELVAEHSDAVRDSARKTREDWMAAEIGLSGGARSNPAAD